MNTDFQPPADDNIHSRHAPGDMHENKGPVSAMASSGIIQDRETDHIPLQIDHPLPGKGILHSRNEVFEMSREELQRINHELTSRNEQITTARQYAESIVATVREPLLVLDKNLRVKTANSAFYKTFRLHEEGTAGVLIYDLGNEQWNIPELRTLLEDILPQRSIFTDFEVRLNFPDTGEQITILNAREMMRDKAEEKLILLAFEDITLQRIAKNKNHEIQQKQAKELEEKVLLRTLELSEANELLLQKNEELLKMNKELESFTYISSHDLQEPLRKIQTYSTLIIAEQQQPVSEKVQDYFLRIRTAAKRMQTLIEDLLTYSHTNLKERKFEHFNLRHIVEEVKNELTGQIREKLAIIDDTHLGNAHINPFQFRQVMQNLITNALKFSLPDIAPVITISSQINTGSSLLRQIEDLAPDQLSLKQLYCCITFSDNGIGFDPLYKDKIFEVFQRLHNKEKYAGTGIGLAIVKKIVDNHNGVIIACGELNKGTTFHILIPEYS